ncbi:Alpha-1,3-mannosyltransferase-like protein [Chytridiales sp. JEL 0842]|nr:Alpha-1,3-mannosyltransferase-like protein [Chytridiales sp. JEL 0842]
MRVAFVHPDLGIGGAERLVVDAAVGLQNHGHSIVMYTSHHDPKHCFQETRDGMIPLRISSSLDFQLIKGLTGTLDVRVRGDFLPRSLLGKATIVFAILRNLYLAITLLLTPWNRYDVIFVDQLSVSIPLLRLTGSKILFYCHFPDKLLSKRQSLIKSIYRLPIDLIEEITTKMADETVVNSRFTRGVFQQSFRMIDRMPRVLYPGIQLESYSQKVDLNDPAVKKLQNGKIMLLSINRFERKKNIGLAIRAFARLRDSLPAKFDKLQLIIAGGYDSRVTENVQHLEELNVLAKSLDLSTSAIKPTSSASDKPADYSTSVLFLPSFNESQRTYLLSHATCLLYTPSEEHFGIVPVEAMYAQLPVVAVNSGGPLESIVDGETGYLCEPNPEAFAKAVKYILEDESGQKKKKMGAAGRQRVVEKFTLDKFVGDLEEILARNMDDDEKIIAMINYIGDPDREPMRADEYNDDISEPDEDADHDQDDHCCPPGQGHNNNALSGDFDELDQKLQDKMLRQQLGVGGAMTGPKGVIADYKFHKQQERSRSDEKKARDWAKVSKSGLQSGWLQRQLEAEKKAGIKGGRDDDDADEEVDDLIKSLEDEEEDAVLQEIKTRRLLEMAAMVNKKRFGKLIEVDVDQYVDCIDKEDPNVHVIIHLYMPYHEACRQVNEFLADLAPRYPYTKFVRIVAIKADSNFDQIALPALLVYKNGDVVTSFMRVTDEIEGWAKTGRCELDAFEEFLLSNKVISEEEAKPITSAFLDSRMGGLSL